MNFETRRRLKHMSQGALDPDWLSFLGRPLAPGFVLRVVVVGPGGWRPYDESEWRHALVVVEWGEIVLEPLAGSSYRFGRGDVLWMWGLALRALRNPGSEPAVLVAVGRRG
jgi:hypothetical protein